MLLQEGQEDALSRVRAAVQLLAEAFGPWMASHILPAALHAGLDLRRDILPAALAALMVSPCLHCQAAAACRPGAQLPCQRQARQTSRVLLHLVCSSIACIQLWDCMACIACARVTTVWLATAIPRGISALQEGPAGADANGKPLVHAQWRLQRSRLPLQLAQLLGPVPDLPQACSAQQCLSAHVHCDMQA